jgi:hypothetical protein
VIGKALARKKGDGRVDYAPNRRLTLHRTKSDGAEPTTFDGRGPETAQNSSAVAGMLEGLRNISVCLWASQMRRQASSK